MNWYKGFHLSQLKCKAGWSRIGLVGGIIIAVAITTPGCKKEVNKDEYYVKYEVNSSTIYSAGKLNVLLTGENNQYKNITINTRVPSETVIGPVKKGFRADMSVTQSGSTDGTLKLYTQISVSKNGSPFALKQINGSDVSRTSVQVSYTIDY